MEKTRKQLLRELERKANKRHLHPVDKARVFAYLNGQRISLNLPQGEVLSIVTLSRGKISVYGKMIPPENIFHFLKLSIGGSGITILGRISYPSLSRLTSWKKGYLVHARTMKLKGNSYIALINIEVDSEDAFYFPAPGSK